MTENTLHHHLGDHAFTALVRAFYARVPADPILGPMYQRSIQQHGETLEHAQTRLRDFLVQRFGGPARYSELRGHPMLRARHMPFAIDRAAAERWLELMELAMTDAQIPDDARAILRPYFHSTAHHMINRA